MKISIVLLTITWSLVASNTCAQDFTISVAVEHIQEIKGSIKYAIYDRSEDFLKKEITSGGAQVTSDRVTFSISDLAVGAYAISIFHDVNDNDELDKNFMGIPSEPYAFSNNAKGMFGPPSFDDCKFLISKNEQVVIKL